MKKTLKYLASFGVYLLVFGHFLLPLFLGEPICIAAEQPSILRVGMPGEPENLAPNDCVDLNGLLVIFHTHERLVTVDPKMNISPQLATSWELTADAIIFHLRKGVRFHDGAPFNAKAVKVSFDRIMTEKLKAISKISGYFKSAEIIDDNTVKIHVLGPPSVALIAFSIFGYIESPMAIEKYDRKDLSRRPIGTGPFKFVEWVSDQRVVLEVNKDYWGGEPKISQIFFKPVRDPQTRLSMLEAGDLDIMVNPDVTELNRLESNPRLKVLSQVCGLTVYLVFNVAKKPFDDKRVREAFSCAIDREAIVKTLLFGHIKPVKYYVAPEVKYAVEYNTYSYDPEKAKSIFGELGWKVGKSGYLEKDGEVFKAAIMSPTGRYPMDIQIAEAVQAQLKKVGIDLKVLSAESATFVKYLMSDVEAKQKAEFGISIVQIYSGPDVGVALRASLHSNSMAPKGMNTGMFSNREFEETLDEANRASNETERGKLLKKAQDIVDRELPFLPIYSWTYFIALRKDVTGVVIPNGYNCLYITKDAKIER